MSRILITGWNGSIGSRLKEALIQQGHDVICPDSKNRIQNENYFEDIEDPGTIDIIYHLAAKITVPKSWEDPAQFIEVNVVGTCNVLDFCKQYDINLVYMSSYIYGIPEYLPIDEKHPVSPTNPYALSKVLAEELVEFYGSNHGLKYNIIRPFNVYGDVQNKSLLIPEIIQQIEKGTEITVKDLNPKRDYIFIDDVIEFLGLLVNDFSNTTYNLGSGSTYSVRDIISLCQKIWGTDYAVSSSDTHRINEIPETLCNIDKVKEKFGWQPKYTMEQGLRTIKERRS